jgi:hypothetical protein
MRPLDQNATAAQKRGGWRRNKPSPDGGPDLLDPMVSALGRVAPDLFVGVFVFFQEPFDASGRVDQLLFAGEKRMALGTDFHPDIFPGGTDLKDIAAGASNRCLMIRGMNIGFHGAKPLSRFPIIRPKDRVKYSWIPKTLYYFGFLAFYQGKIPCCPPG